VALYNRLADRRLAWLADEVGMGKTYVALGVVALLRHQNPDARVLFIVPSGRLQVKWRKEIALFTRSCVTQIDHRARTFQDLPARALVTPARLYDLAAEMAVDADRDVLATMSSFSFGLGDKATGWQQEWEALAGLAPRLPSRLPEAFVRDKATFKRVYAAALNLFLPDFDLVVCDESHNLRAGAGHGAARNQTMAAALGGHVESLSGLPWEQPPQPRVARLLCLTATPVERRYDELARQAEVFGLDCRPDVPLTVRKDLLALRGASSPDDVQKGTARRYVIRRIQELRPKGLPDGENGFTKNQYRREWRHGGMETHDERFAIATHREKLMVALVQKQVVEVLHKTGARQADGTFLPSFQMGMLSSFESFSETIANRVDKATQPVYDGEDQTSDEGERKGVDSGVVDRICRSYRETFGTSPPHPKMDQVADQVAEWAAVADKTLVFVRRVRSTEELAEKISQRLDEALIARVLAELNPSARAEMLPWVAAWRSVGHNAQVDRALAASGDDDDDAGGADSFFAWFFRGSGKEAHQVAAKLRKVTLQQPAHPWSIFFHDNHLLWLFADDRAGLATWASTRTEPLVAGVRRFMPDVEKPGARHYFEAWQAAALALLGHEDPSSDVGRAARDAQQRLYPQARKTLWSGDPQVQEGWLLRETFFSRLRSSELAEALWPGASRVPKPGVDALGDREVRRELIGSTLRLGYPFVDLWLSAVNLMSGLTVADAQERVPVEDLANELLDRLRGQRDAPLRAHNAWHELTELALHHRLLLDVNFSDVKEKELHQLTRYFQSHLSRQSPALAMHGASKSTQALTQFRMPGYPLVLVATDVLQEGVDLHTFCARVVHYGIAHTSSATEQRTGRVDRIGSLVHRRFAVASDPSRLQVHYPHLMDTVEPLQLRELYRRMDLFLRLVHDGLGVLDDESSRVSLHDGMQQDVYYPQPPVQRLKTAFDVVSDGDGGDLAGGQLARVPPLAVDPGQLEAVVRELLHDVRPSPAGYRWVGQVTLDAQRGGSQRRQPVLVALRTRSDGRGAYLRVESPVGAVDLSNGNTAGRFLRRQADLVGVVVAVEDGAVKRRKPFILVRCDIALLDGQDLRTRLGRALGVVAPQADALEREFMGQRQDLGIEDWEQPCN
jgi:hypothetical protein